MKKSHAILVLIVSALIVLNTCRKEEMIVSASVSPADYLSAQKYERMEVQLVYVNGYFPGNNEVASVQSFLEARLNKPGGITFTTKSIGSPQKASLSLDDIRKIEQENRSSFTTNGKITTYVFFADAPYAGNSGNSQILGMAYSASSIVIFEKTVRQNSGGLTQPPHATLETTVMDHEFGHIMGLVDFGTPMVSPHKDAANGNHCINQNCLMYYNVETTDVVANLLGGNVPQLDADCLADLRANGGK